VRVILKAEVRGLGRTGEIKDVATATHDYLLPKGLAIEATGGELKLLAHERQSEKTKKDGRTRTRRSSPSGSVRSRSCSS